MQCASNEISHVPMLPEGSWSDLENPFKKCFNQGFKSYDYIYDSTYTYMFNAALHVTRLHVTDRRTKLIAHKG